jgi:excisionase family DNA binding protein
LTPEEAAETLRVSAEQVRCLIRTRQLAAINVGTGPKRPLYRITTQAVQEFLSRRWLPGPATKPRRFMRRPSVQDHFPDLK